MRLNELIQGTQNVTTIEGDSSQTLKTIESGSIQLIVTSPPYNLGKQYGKKREPMQTLEE